MSGKATSRIYDLPDVRLFDAESPLAQGRRFTLIRRRNTSPGPRRLILFVHGLNSSADTWTPFVRAAYGCAELAAFDFAAFEYQTSFFGRVKLFSRKVDAEDWSRVFSDTLQHAVLSEGAYDQVVLVGHSMGGLVAKMALRDLYDDEDDKALRRIHSLFTYATPHFGSDKAYAAVAAMSHDVSFLRKNSDAIGRLTSFWNEHAGPGKSIDIPQRAVVSASDKAVEIGSARGGLNSTDIFHVGTSHTEVHKPENSGDRRISWFCEQLKQLDQGANIKRIAIRHLPPAAAMDPERRSFYDHLLDLVFVLGVGARDGIAEGDEFQLLYDQKSEQETERAPDPFASPPWHLLKATRVDPETTIARMDSLAYVAAIERMHAARDALGLAAGAVPDSETLESIVDQMFGSRARQIAREETNAMRFLSDAKSRANQEPRGSQAWQRATIDVLDRSEQFINRFPDSPHTEQALFDRAFATKTLGRIVEAQRRFQRFVERFPLSVSAPGARGHLEELALREALANNPNSAHAALRLGAYLLNVADFYDGIPILCKVLGAHPEETSNLAPETRLAMFYALVANDLLGIQFDSPADYRDWLRDYCDSPDLIATALSRIQELEHEEGKRVLTDIHESVADDVEQAQSSAAG